MAADKVTGAPVANHLGAADAAKGAQRGHEINGLENVGLALSVVSQEQMKAGRKIEIQPRVIAEVTEAQMSQGMSRRRLLAGAGAGASAVAVVEERDGPR